MSSPQPGRFEGGAIWTEELVLDSRALTDLVSIAFDSGETLVFDGSQGEIDGEVTVTLSGTEFAVTGIEYHSGGQVYDVVEWHRGPASIETPDEVDPEDPITLSALDCSGVHGPSNVTLHDGTSVSQQVYEAWDPHCAPDIDVSLELYEAWDNQEV